MALTFWFSTSVLDLLKKLEEEKSWVASTWKLYILTWYCENSLSLSGGYPTSQGLCDSINALLNSVQYFPPTQHNGVLHQMLYLEL